MGLPVSFHREPSSSHCRDYYRVRRTNYNHLVATIEALVETTPTGTLNAMVASVMRRLHDIFGSVDGIKNRSRLYRDIITRCRNRFNTFLDYHRKEGEGGSRLKSLFRYHRLEDRRRVERRRQAKILALRVSLRERLQYRGPLIWNKMLWRLLRITSKR